MQWERRAERYETATVAPRLSCQMGEGGGKGSPSEGSSGGKKWPPSEYNQLTGLAVIYEKEECEVTSRFWV